MAAWIMLACAIGFEIVATSSIKSTVGFTRLLPTLGVLAAYGISFYALSQAVRTIEIGVAYAVWSGVGTAVIAIVGILFQGDSFSMMKVTALALIIAGVVILNLSTAHS